MNKSLPLSRIFLNSGQPLFQQIKSISNLVKPDFNQFIAAVKESYDNGSMAVDGIQVKKLEHELAIVHGTKYCITFCNGLWGIVLAIKALALAGKSEVIMPAMTYRRLADIAAWLGLTPHFCDVAPNILGASVTTVAKCINTNTALLLIAQPIVNVCDMEALE